MRLAFITFTLLLLLPAAVAHGGADTEAAAEASAITNAGTTPGSIFYGLDRAAERIGLALTPSKEGKAMMQLANAEERLAEAKAVADRGQHQHVAPLMQAYEQGVAAARMTAQEVAEEENRRKVQHAAAEAVQKHQAVLEQVYNRVPVQAQEAVSHAMNASRTGHRQIVAALEQSGEIPDGVEPAIPAPATGEAVPGRGQPSDRMERQDQAPQNDSGERTVEERIGVNESSDAQ